jgi:alpha-tubulin suppressor-like RCC1 family protein
MIVWGRNQMGQLGIDPTAQSVIKFPTLSVNIRGWNSGSYPYSIYNVRQIACGKAHTMILIERDGIDIIFALGNNKQGQLGIGRGAGNIVT